MAEHLDETNLSAEELHRMFEEGEPVELADHCPYPYHCDQCLAQATPPGQLISWDDAHTMQHPTSEEAK